MSKTEPTTDDSEDQEQDERMQVADGVYIEDAFIDWQLNYSNAPTLYVVTSEPIPDSEWQPVEADPGDDYWVDQNDYGLWHGWQADLPVSEETGMQTSTIEHAELGTVEDRYRMFDYVVSRYVNDEVPHATATVRFITGPTGSTQGFAVWVGVIQMIIEKYVNGPLGSEKTPLWYWKRSHSDSNASWHSGPWSKEDFEGYLTPEVVLVKDWNHTWHPKRREDLEEDDEVFPPEIDQ